MKLLRVVVVCTLGLLGCNFDRSVKDHEYVDILGKWEWSITNVDSSLQGYIHLFSDYTFHLHTIIETSRERLTDTHPRSDDKWRVMGEKLCININEFKDCRRFSLIEHNGSQVLAYREYDGDPMIIAEKTSSNTQ